MKTFNFINENVSLVKNSLFQTDKMMIVGDENRCIFIAYGLNGIMTFKFENFRSGYRQKKAAFFIDIGRVKKISNTVIDTFVLLNNGDVFLFDTYKSLQQVKDINNCLELHCFGSDKILLLCKQATNLILKISKRSQNSLKERLKINLGPITSHSALTIRNVSITEKNINLFQALVNDVTNEKNAVLFTAGSVAYFVSFIGAGCSVLKQFPSAIKALWFSEKLNCILVLTEVGYIEIVFYNNYTKTIGQEKVFMDMDIVGFELIEQDIFIYSTDSEANIIKFKRNGDTFNTSRHTIDVFGVISFFYHSKQETIFCLAKNNIIFEIDPAENSQESSKSQIIAIEEDFTKKTEYLENLLRFEFKSTKLLNKTHNLHQFWIDSLQCFHTVDSKDSAITVNYQSEAPTDVKGFHCVNLSSDIKQRLIYVMVTVNISNAKLLNQSNVYVLLNIKRRSTKNLSFPALRSSIKIIIAVDKSASSKSATELPKISGFLVIIVGPKTSQLLKLLKLKVAVRPNLETFIKTTETSLYKYKALPSFSLINALVKLINQKTMSQFSIKSTKMRTFIQKICTPNALLVLKDFNLIKENQTYKSKISVFDKYVELILKDNVIQLRSNDCGAIKWAKIFIYFKIIENTKRQNIVLINNIRALNAYMIDVAGINQYANKIKNVYNNLRALPVIQK